MRGSPARIGIAESGLLRWLSRCPIVGPLVGTRNQRTEDARPLHTVQIAAVLGAASSGTAFRLGPSLDIDPQAWDASVRRFTYASDCGNGP